MTCKDNRGIKKTPATLPTLNIANKNVEKIIDSEKEIVADN